MIPAEKDCRNMKGFAVVCVAVQFLQTVLAAKILVICAVPSPSHSIWCYKYMETLAERGHQITVLGVDQPTIKIPNLTTFIATEVYPAITRNDSVAGWFIGENAKIKSWYIGYKNSAERSSRAIMHSKALEKLMQHYKNIKKPFDLIIHDNGNAEALLGLVPLFGNPPLLLATTMGCPHWMNFNAGNILNPAYVPNMIMSANQYMTFYERCVNTFYHFFLEWFYRQLTDMQDQLMREVFGEDIPHVRKIVKKANIVIYNYNIALNDPIPLLPGVIGISGMHITEPKPLPQDIKEFMDGAKNGVILASFGTNVDSHWLQPNFETVMVQALGLLPQRVLWKWDNNLVATPPNIKISKWLPQGDILGHPNLKLFVTHCGLLSIQEAIYHRVPMLALPVFFDQVVNADMLVRRNLAIQFNIKTITANELHHGIEEILSNPKYRENIKKISELMVDMPQAAKQQAVFWTEYAIRHQGAAHLHATAADMSWHQLLLLDVIALVLVIMFATVWLIKVFLLFMLKRIFSKVKSKSD